jgi:hypothetical protein
VINVPIYHHITICLWLVHTKKLTKYFDASVCSYLLPRLSVRVITPISLPKQDWMAYTAYYLKHNYVFVIQKEMRTEVWRVFYWSAEGFDSFTQY